jgi:hypothetical protein
LFGRQIHSLAARLYTRARNAQGPDCSEDEAVTFAPFRLAVSALARYVIVLALDDVVDLEHFGLSRKLDPNVL